MLEELAQEPSGIPFGEASKALQSALTMDEIELFGALARLLKIELLQLDDESGFLSADLERLGLDRSARASIVLPTESFESKGTPVSEAAVKGVSELFSSRQAVYLMVESSGRHQFPDLYERAKAARDTYCIFPPRNSVPSERREAYDRALKEWIDYVARGDRFVRTHVKVLIAQEGSRFLYLSVLTAEKVRYTLYTYASGVRYGQLVEAAAGSSLYEAVERHFRDVVRQGRPVWKFWKKDRLRWFARRWVGVVFGTLVAGALTLLGGDFNLFAAALVAGVVANGIFALLRERRWSPPALFDPR